MSMFVKFLAVPNSVIIPSFGEAFDYLEMETPDHMIEYKPEVKRLGLYTEGKWVEEDFLNLYRGQHFGSALGKIIPEEEYYRVLTLEMITAVEASMVSAVVYDAAKARGLERDRGKLPDAVFNLLAAVGKKDTVESFVTRFVLSAKQALTEFGEEYQILVEVS